MDLGLRGKSVFISGSTSGIGFATAKLFLEEGAIVYINGRSKDSVLIAIDRLKGLVPDAQVSGLDADFSDLDTVNSLLNKLPDLDILINNVGIYSSHSFFETSDASWKEQFEVNVMSGVRLSREVLPQMIEKKWGRVVFVSSECATLVPEDLIAYSATKAALHAVSRGLAQLTRGTEVTVNTIIPGSTMTEGAADFIANLAEKEQISPEEAEANFFNEVRTSSLIQRFTKVEEIASSIVYFSSPLSSATNGAAIKLDGGSMGGIL